jgi:hypothetical protein
MYTVVRHNPAPPAIPAPVPGRGEAQNYLRFFSQRWFASVQEVLQADWHEVWHSPQPVFSLFAFNVPFTMVLTCFIPLSSVCLVFT